MRLLIVLMALCGLALSGCLGGVGTITAKDGLSDAREAAEILADGSVELMSVASLEPFSELHDEEDDAHIYVHLDDTPGDGIAPGWVYEFRSGDDAIAIAYASGLGVLAEVFDGGAYAESDAESISGWNIDSDTAAKALAKHENWPAPTDSSAYFWMLMQADECPVWSVEAADLEEDGWWEAAVDGCTGEVLHVDSGSMIGGCSSGTATGSGSVLPMSNGGVAYTTLAAPGTVSYDVNLMPTVGELYWTLTGPEGIVGQGTSSASDALDDMPPGEYTLTVEADVGTGQYSYYLSTFSCS